MKSNMLKVKKQRIEQEIAGWRKRLVGLDAKKKFTNEKIAALEADKVVVEQEVVEALKDEKEKQDRNTNADT